MGSDKSFCVASKNVHSQKFDDEVVIIDTVTGVYLTLGGSAVDIWSQIEAGASQGAIAAALFARYDGDPGVISAAVGRCLADLLQDGLIREAPPSSEMGSSVVAPGPRLVFAEPLIARFTDMQNLLLLDPIHEVSEEGWPQPISKKKV